MDNKQEKPEYVKQAVNLIAAVLRRIKGSETKAQNPCLRAVNNEREVGING